MKRGIYRATTFTTQNYQQDQGVNIYSSFVVFFLYFFATKKMLKKQQWVWSWDWGFAPIVIRHLGLGARGRQWPTVLSILRPPLLTLGGGTIRKHCAQVWLLNVRVYVFLLTCLLQSPANAEPAPILVLTLLAFQGQDGSGKGEASSLNSKKPFGKIASTGWYCQ